MSNTTIQQPSTGPNIIQVADFFQKAGVLHPLVIGTIILVLLFAYLRMSSNRSVAPMSLFDSIVGVALGSTLAGIVVRIALSPCLVHPKARPLIFSSEQNGTALVRGIVALFVLLFWQYITSYVAMRWPNRTGDLLISPALVIAYRGKALERIMHKHRVSYKDLNGALRAANVWNICEIEVRLYLFCRPACSKQGRC